jgi:hypothetical protein
MAAGYLDATLSLKFKEGKIKNGGGTYSDINHVQPGSKQGIQQAFLETRGAETAIAAKNDFILAQSAQIRAECFPDALHHVIGQISVCHTPDIVFSKDVRIHRPAPFPHPTEFETFHRQQENQKPSAE